MPEGMEAWNLNLIHRKLMNPRTAEVVAGVTRSEFELHWEKQKKGKKPKNSHFPCKIATSFRWDNSVGSDFREKLLRTEEIVVAAVAVAYFAVETENCLNWEPERDISAVDGCPRLGNSRSPEIR